jgi:hypothetical protein
MLFFLLLFGEERKEVFHIFGFFGEQCWENYNLLNSFLWAAFDGEILKCNWEGFTW